jgi:hypothetical protein
VNVVHKKCEGRGCSMKNPTFVLPAEGKKRWHFGALRGWRSWTHTALSDYELGDDATNRTR